MKVLGPAGMGDDRPPPRAESERGDGRGRSEEARGLACAESGRGVRWRVICGGSGDVRGSL